ncbi:YggS family pyridoxal phosphate enzyme [Deinococcus sp.]|uniref:YggS family pyridoxal phosphate enzyme n=1 Tax=Deinococcus sp. TaxID=47478 RepID=UPI003CC59FDF
MIDEVISELRAAEAAAGRPSGSARLVAVSKGQSLEQIGAAVLSRAELQTGGFALAENRGQELRDKVAEAAVLGWPDPEWHFIGPVQSNKVKYLRAVSLVHTVENAGQAQAIAQAAQQWGRAPDVLLQLHNGEAQKHGVAAAGLLGLLRAVRESGLRVRGLMVMAPYGDPARAGAVFAETALRAHDLGLAELSMGMSDDFPLAVRHGATLVRVGRRLFAPPLPH